MNPLTELELMRKILEKVHTPLTSEEILSFALQGIKDTFGYLTCSIILVDPSRQYFKVVLSKGWSNEFIKSYHGKPFSGLLSEFAGMDKPLLVKPGDPRHQAAGYRFEHPYAAFLAVPMTIRGRKIGLLFLSSAKADDFPPERQQMMQDLANLCTLVLDISILGDQVLTLSQVDPLTNLYSYKYWHEEFHREVAKAKTMDNVFAVAEIRLNHLKEFNSALGHVKGDEVLVEYSRAIRGSLDEIDIPCRVGGRWFLLLTGKDEKASRASVERVLAALDKLPRRGDPPLVVSIGAAVYNRGEGEEHILNRVGEALMDARRKKGNAYHLA